MSNKDSNSTVNISQRLQSVLDQLGSVSIFDNKNCINSNQNSRIQEDESKIDKIPRD